MARPATADPGSDNQSPRHRYPLSLSAGQGTGQCIGPVLQANARQHLQGKRTRLFTCHSSRQQSVADVIQHTTIREQRVILKYHAHIALVYRNASHLLMAKKHLALIGAYKPGQHTQQARLATARGAQQSKQGAAGNLQIQATEQGLRAVALLNTRQMYLHKRPA